MKRILRSALAGGLCLAMLITPCTVSNALGADATFENAVLNPDGTIKVSGINWDNADPRIELKINYEWMYVDYCIKKPENASESFTTEDTVTKMMRPYFDESGSYDIYVSMQDNGSIDPVYCEKKITVSYNRPKDEMPVPTNVHWDGYTLKWNGDGNSSYVYEMTWIKEDGREIGPWFYLTSNGFSEDMTDEVQFRIGQGCKKLKCSVKTVSSGDAKIKANSKKIEAPVLIFDEQNAEVSNKLGTIPSDQPEKIKDVFNTDGEKDKLMVGMTTEEDIADRIATIEQAYTRSENITVRSADVSEEVKSLGVNAGNIKVIGAGLNAISGESVTLKVSKSEDEAEIPSDCYNPVQLDIKLDIAGTNKTNLDIPISITMPIPKGVEKQGLVIYHVHSNGQKEFVSQIRNNADGTITFAVKDFSTFVFANKKGAAGSDNDSDKKRTTYRTPVENAIKQAVATGGTTEISGITALSYDEMKELSKNPDAKLVMHFTYKDEKYKVIVTGKDAVADPTIPWYGPLYLVGKYGNALTAGK